MHGRWPWHTATPASHPPRVVRNQAGKSRAFRVLQDRLEWRAIHFAAHRARGLAHDAVVGPLPGERWRSCGGGVGDERRRADVFGEADEGQSAGLNSRRGAPYPCRLAAAIVECPRRRRGTGSKFFARDSAASPMGTSSNARIRTFVGVGSRKLEVDTRDSLSSSASSAGPAVASTVDTVGRGLYTPQTP